MLKVHVAPIPTASNSNGVRINTICFVFSSLFVANLVTEPLKAYVSEPLPWALNATLLNNTNMTLDMYAQSTYSVFVTKYNNRTLSPDAMVSRDKGANTILLRYNMTLPSNETERCDSYLFQFPGSMLFSYGTIQFVCNFLAQNTSTQLSMPRYSCQHHIFAGLFVTADSCIWIEPFPTPGHFSVYHGLQLVENHWWIWIKFGLRLVLSGCILGEIWRMYYQQYGPLVLNLKIYGIPTAIDRMNALLPGTAGKIGDVAAKDESALVYYDIHMGDPTWVILSHPYICAAMTVDILYSTSYSVVALFRVCQLQDLWQFIMGSFSGSNFVWASYTAMRFSTPLIKRLGWESYFEPLDPGIMTLTSAFYAGPMLYLICHSRLVYVFQILGRPLSANKMEAIEVALGIIFTPFLCFTTLSFPAVSICSYMSPTPSKYTW
ncbi:Aste57867_19751 [Aphanomyces stellatus]|uniref:Aste57867_19751 protein n=1 Tax=Aphanomyces stellatus TaxID=120398 RepID=A0A485LDF4_9STRA|nr:hypothetical protein As57867_019686 [Aphanomyces stellatus]VFT96449.1 Aste57867_19751 [Aphanomyces stellatus]